VSKADHDLKRLKITEATRAWLEAEQAKHPELTAQEIVRDRLHAIALKEIHAATVLSGIAARRGIRA
jgi:hypothetical protein